MNRLDVYVDARHLAEKLGAVKDGSNWFENENGDGIWFTDLANGDVSTDEVCRVCAAGALLLADLMRGGTHPMSMSSSYMTVAGRAARTVLGDDREGALSTEITVRGTPYVLAILDRLIAEEAAAVSSDPSHTYVVA